MSGIIDKTIVCELVNCLSWVIVIRGFIILFSLPLYMFKFFHYTYTKVKTKVFTITIQIAMRETSASSKALCLRWREG